MPDTLLYAGEIVEMKQLVYWGEAGMERDMMQSALHNQQDLQNPRSRVSHCGRTGRDV